MIPRLRRHRRDTAASLRALPRRLRWAVLGAASLGAIGAIVGLIVGLLANAATAPFAVVEVGLPATIGGGLVGLAAGALTTTLGRVKRDDA